MFSDVLPKVSLTSSGKFVNSHIAKVYEHDDNTKNLEFCIKTVLTNNFYSITFDNEMYLVFGIECFKDKDLCTITESNAKYFCK